MSLSADEVYGRYLSPAGTPGIFKIRAAAPFYCRLKKAFR
jgi:hypothetical protein